MAEAPKFYCMKTLLSYHPGPDLNRITLNGPEGFEFVLYNVGEARDPGANSRCDNLANKLSALWQKD